MHVSRHLPPRQRRRRDPPSPQPQISVGTILLLAAACGLIVANIYYAQPLIGPIAQSLGLAPQAAGRYCAIRARRRLRRNRRADHRQARRSRLESARDPCRDRSGPDRLAPHASPHAGIFAGASRCRRGRDRFRRSGQPGPRLSSHFPACSGRSRTAQRHLSGDAVRRRGSRLGAGAWAYARGGWTLACSVGLAPPLVALARFLLRAGAGRD
jgi:hypothetical protein